MRIVVKATSSQWVVRLQSIDEAGRTAVMPRRRRWVHVQRWRCAMAMLIWLMCETLAAGQQATGGVPVPPAAGVSGAAKRTGSGAVPGSAVFRMRVLDGRNGLPVVRAHVRLWYDEAGDAGYPLETDASGVALMPEPLGVPVRVLVAVTDRVDCRKVREGEPAPGYNLQAIAGTGVAAENRCGAVTEKPRPGELVLFVRAARWYEGINRQ